MGSFLACLALLCFAVTNQIVINNQFDYCDIIKTSPCTQISPSSGFRVLDSANKYQIQQIKMQNIRTWRMVWWGKCLLCKPEDLSLDLQHPLKARLSSAHLQS